MQHDNFDSHHSHGFIRVAAATPLVATADPARNAAATIDLVREADRQGVDLVVFPELGLSSYAIDDLILQDALIIAVIDAIQIATAASTDLRSVIFIGAPLRHRGRLYNCAIGIHRGQVLGIVPKTYLPNYREFYEKRWFVP